MKIRPIMLVICVCILSAIIFGFNYADKNTNSNTNITESTTEETTTESSEEVIEVETIEETTTKIAEETDEIEQNPVIASLDSNDLIMLQKISLAEAGGETTECMALVMQVILNRIQFEEFPDSVEEVIFQKVCGVAQFTPTINGSYNKAEPNEKSKEALELVLSGWDESQGALYFEDCGGESWHSRNLELLLEKDGIRFYK